MEKVVRNCTVCLQNEADLRQITEIDNNNRSVVCKLRSCVPEIDWKEDYMICGPCNADLDLVYLFREKCLNSENLRSQETVASRPFPSEDNCGSISERKSQKSSQFACQDCNLTFLSSTKLVAHSVKVHHTEAKTVKPFVCHICDNRFACSSNLLQHLKYHNGSRTHVCTYCGKSYVTKSDLTIHEKTHLNKREYKCEHCSKCFNTHKDLRSHKLVVHTDPSLWQHVCELCSKRFPIKSNYDAHMRRHKDERPFACHLCDKKFIDKSVLQKHFRSHTNNRAYVCDICKKEYKDKHIMSIHKKKIHGVGDVKVPVRVKKYLCHVCPKAYFDKNKLTRHLCTHTGEKPYFCRICQKKFIDKSYVKQHMRKTHNVVENE